MGNCEKPSPIADQVFILLVQLYRFVTVGDIVFDRLHDQSHHRSLWHAQATGDGRKLT